MVGSDVRKNRPSNLVSFPSLQVHPVTIGKVAGVYSRHHQNGNPMEKCQVPDGSTARGLSMRPYSSRNGPIMVS